MLLDHEHSFACNETIFGSFGYELEADCEGDAAFRTPLPDAAFAFAHRLMAVDHVERATYALCLADASQGREGRRWVRGTRRRLDSLPAAREPSAHPAPRTLSGSVIRTIVMDGESTPIGAGG
jgi:para-aminobenzoate synthetase